MRVNKLQRLWRLVILCQSHKLHNDGFQNLRAVMAHRAAILEAAKLVQPEIVEDGKYYRVTTLNNFRFHSEKLNLLNAIKLYDELK